MDSDFQVRNDYDVSSGFYTDNSAFTGNADCHITETRNGHVEHCVFSHSDVCKVN